MALLFSFLAAVSEGVGAADNATAKLVRAIMDNKVRFMDVSVFWILIVNVWSSATTLVAGWD